MHGKIDINRDEIRKILEAALAPKLVGLRIRSVSLDYGNAHVEFTDEPETKDVDVPDPEADSDNH